MGVIYKLKPQIINFILEQKKANPKLSCRKLMPLIEKEFQARVSKSSINSIFKQAGLSMPAGRRAHRPLEIPVEPQEMPVEPQAPVEPQEITESQAAPLEAPEAPVALPETPVEAQAAPAEPPRAAPQPLVFDLPLEKDSPGFILLRAVDSILGGSRLIDEAIKNKLNISPVISDIFQEVRCIEINISDGNIIYLDGQFHTIWSGPYIPYDFSISICNVRSYINKYFTENSPIVLFMAPGYDTPTKEFLSFLTSLTSSINYVTSLGLLGSKLEKLEHHNLGHAKKRKVVFSLWPWQFVEFRRVKKIGEFKPVFIGLLNQEFYTAEVEIELLQPQLNQSLTIKGYALKMKPEEKTRVLIFSNFPDEIAEPKELLELYLAHWPNFEEGFQDFSRKIELFTYTGSSRRFFSPDMLGWQDTATEPRDISNRYLEALDLYAKWHFFPSEYAEKGFEAAKEHFYDLKTTVKQEGNCTFVTFQIPPAYQFPKQLEYILRRLNEREALLPDKTKLRFLV